MLLRFLLVILIHLPLWGLGQISGTILSTEGDTLSFASVYVKGSSIGTNSNIEGNYILTLEPGSYDIVYQFVGYKNLVKTIQVSNTPIEVNIQLLPEVYSLSEISISADAEDPAYAIIRNSIKKRKYYKNLVEKFSVDVYVKGNQEVLSMPEKILGQSVGDLDGMLDSSRTGIVYLSETLSKYHFQAPNDYKEVIVSSKLSGDDNGYSFNSAMEMEFNIYDNTIDLNRELVSPIASNALSYYNYKLLGTSYDEDKRLINKIQVNPKRSNDPCFKGYIYIIEDLWNVHSLNLDIPKEASQLSFLDSLNLSQVFIPVKGPDVFCLFSNTISFAIKIFGVNIEGQFAANYSDYNLNPQFEEKFFSNEVYKVERESNKRSTTYWDSIRPVPLTLDEVTDYRVKDSIQIIRKSPEYLDSVDREANKFEFTDLIFGYERQNSIKKERFGYSSILSNLAFNTVQGYRLGTSIDYRKYYNESETRRLKVKANVGYGLSEKVLRAHVETDFLFNFVDFSRIKFSGGKQIRQFNDLPVISEFANEIYSLFFRRNWAKYYDKTFIALGREHEIFNGVYYDLQLEYSDRKPLTNHSETSYFYKNSRTFSPNNPLYPSSELPTLEHQALILDLDIRFRINQKYFSYPDLRFVEPSAWPSFFFHFRQGFKSLGADSKFTMLGASMRGSYSLGVRGNFEFMINGAKFFNASTIQFVDYKHFNTSQILLTNPENYFKSFLLMPYYEYSTADAYFQAHVEHHFNGYFLDKIPLLNKLGWRLVAGGKYLWQEEKRYSELHFGIDNMGIGLFKLLRWDFVWSFENEQSHDFGFRLGIGFDN